MKLQNKSYYKIIIHCIYKHITYCGTKLNKLTTSLISFLHTMNYDKQKHIKKVSLFIACFEVKDPQLKPYHIFK